MSGLEQTNLAWRLAAFFIGAALPLKVFGPSVMFVWLLLGILFGFAAMGRTLWQGVTWSGMFKTTGCRNGFVVMLTLAVSTLFGIDPTHAARQLYELSLVSAGGLLLFVALRDMPNRHVHTLLHVLVIFTAIISFLALLDGLFPIKFLARALSGHHWNQPARLNPVSSILAVTMPLMWVWLVKRFRAGRTPWDWLALPLAAMCFIAVFVCGGRFGCAGAVAACFVFLFLGARWHGLVLHTRHWLLLPLALLACVAAYGFASGWGHLFDRGLWPERIKVWHTVVENLLIQPISGIGPNNFHKLPLLHHHIPAHPYNWVLQILLEGGFISAVAVGAMLFYLLRYLWRHSQVNLYALGGFCAMVGYFVSSLGNFSIFQSWWVSYFVVLSILAVRFCRTERIA